jgi:uncharacterized protein (DUF4415 family)
MQASNGADETPPLGNEFFQEAKPRIGLKPVSRAEFAEAVREKLGKRKVSIMLDNAVIDFFKAKAGGSGYQTLINATLREAMRESEIAETLRRVIREELHPT